MCSAIDNPTSCEIRADSFLRFENMSDTEIHRELCAVYSQNIMTEGTARQRCRMFEDGQKNIHDEERSVRSFVVINNLVGSVDQENCERRRFTTVAVLTVGSSSLGS
jgi:hypothetical protein